MKKQPVYWLMVVGVIAASVVIVSPLIDRVEAIIITISVIVKDINLHVFQLGKITIYQIENILTAP